MLAASAGTWGVQVITGASRVQSVAEGAFIAQTVGPTNGPDNTQLKMDTETDLHAKSHAVTFERLSSYGDLISQFAEPALPKPSVQPCRRQQEPDRREARQGRQVPEREERGAQHHDARRAPPPLQFSIVRT